MSQFTAMMIVSAPIAVFWGIVFWLEQQRHNRAMERIARDALTE